MFNLFKMKNTNKILLGVGMFCIFVMIVTFVIAIGNESEKGLNKTINEASNTDVPLAVQANNSILNKGMLFNVSSDVIYATYGFKANISEGEIIN